MRAVELREIGDDNREAVLALRVGESQTRFVSSVAESLQEAAETPEGRPWYRAVYAEGRPVGFVMLSWDVSPDPPRIHGPWFLWKLIVDERRQRQGIGRAVVERVADLVTAEGGRELLTSFVPGEGGPEPFYRSLGFVPTGELDESGEVVLARPLQP